jgi:TolA-binding protein
MNSDKFDRVVLDLLYGELDELTTAAAKRHMEQSARAREIYAHLKVTRQLGVLPTHSPPPDFEQALMQRVGLALAELPVHHRIGRIVSMLAGYAMRPQLIMGALLLLMIGSSLMFLRARPGQHSAVQVTERGAPESDAELVLPVNPQTLAARPAGTPASPSNGQQQPSESANAALYGREPASVSSDAGAEGLAPFDQALANYRSAEYAEAQRGFERIGRAGGPRAAEAALYAAQATRNLAGCAPAVVRFERVRLRFPGSPFAYEAAWRAAQCLNQLGDLEGARQTYESLLHVPNYAERAQQALAALGITNTQTSVETRSDAAPSRGKRP